MVFLNRWLTTGTPDGYYVLPLILYGFCLALLLPAVGFGTVARVQENQLLDGVSLYMTFRQLGASLGVALLAIVIEQRETLHSSRLFEHLRQSSIRTQSALSGTQGYLATHLGHGLTGARDAPLKLLHEAGSKQAATLSYADAFLFMAFVGSIALCFVPLVPPLPQKPTAGVSPQIKLAGS
jgi:DHA2 family multidrug resistance protein